MRTNQARNRDGRQPGHGLPMRNPVSKTGKPTTTRKTAEASGVSKSRWRLQEIAPRSACMAAIAAARWKWGIREAGAEDLREVVTRSDFLLRRDRRGQDLLLAHVFNARRWASSARDGRTGQRDPARPGRRAVPRPARGAPWVGAADSSSLFTIAA